MLLHIDTDLGVDDGLALVVASRLSGVSIASVSTVFGNVDLATATRNTALFRHMLEADWPIYAGAERPARGNWQPAFDVHGPDGLGGATADVALAAAVRALPAQGIPPISELPPADRDIAVVGLGPATNIRALVDRLGRSRVTHVVLMGGVFFDIGNIAPSVEFNAGCDPEALAELTGTGLPITIVPLDVCRKIQLMRETVSAYEDGSPLMRAVVRSHMHYMDHYREWEGIDGCFPHDAVTILVAAFPERFWSIRGRVSVAGDGTTTFQVDAGSALQVVMGGDLRFVREGLRTLDFTDRSQPTKPETAREA